MNSLKSVCSFAKSTPVTFDQFEKKIEPFFRRQVGIELIVGSVRIFKTAKDLRDTVHERTLACCPRDRSPPRGSYTFRSRFRNVRRGSS